ncbi:MAG: hypothetical protein LBP88_07920 [Treponema sp.]|jgi:CxxC motif-containing protein|nr:hypothetical protein [Treponema sp.]
MKVLTGSPIGCSLQVTPGHQGGFAALTITGNGCQRGAAYAQEEVRSPKGIGPQERIAELLADIDTIRVTRPVKTGDTVIAGCTGVRVVPVRSIG